MWIASNIPCNGCQSRTPTCHGKCERYLEYRSARIKMLEHRKKQNAADEMAKIQPWIFAAKESQQKYWGRKHNEY